MKLVLASSNVGKLAELGDLLGDTFELHAQSGFGIDDAEETGLSFIENAILKARHAARATGLPALGDDSGLCVDALDGAPGLYSARYAGRPPEAEATAPSQVRHIQDAANIDKLLRELDGINDARRSARFVCVLAFLRHPEDPQPLIAEGVWEGRILHARRGTNGFGYDPVFFSPAHGCSAAELDAAVKNRGSHRGLALTRLRTQLLDADAVIPAKAGTHGR